MSSLGLLFAVIALLSFTVGDYFIQRGTRVFGNWKTLAMIGTVGMFGIYPFIHNDLHALLFNVPALKLLAFLSAVTLVAALFLFEGLKRGKFAVIEPVFGIELPITVLLAVLLANERFPVIVYVFIALVFVGLFLTVTKRPAFFLRKGILERGVAYAAFGSILMGVMNFFTGLSSQALSPLMTIWFVHTFLAVACVLYLVATDDLHELIADIRKHPGTALGLSIFDNIAWLGYAASMVLIPISIATALSESYIALTVLVGVYINKEKLKTHQWAGIIVVIISVLALSLLAV